MIQQKRVRKTIDEYSEEPTPKIGKTEELEEKITVDEKQGNVWVLGDGTLPVSKFPLSQAVVKGLDSLSIKTLFPVQRAVIPATLAMHSSMIAGDLLVGSPTGSGKSLAYVVPMVELFH